MRQRCALAASFALLLGLWVCPALARQCAEQHPRDIARSASVAFVATVVSLEPAQRGAAGCIGSMPDRPACGAKVVTMRVRAVLKGHLPELATVLAEDSCVCLGADFAIGEDYLVIAAEHGAAPAGPLLAENVCSGTGPMSAQRQKAIVKEFSRAR